jgi:hypothetical protein
MNGRGAASLVFVMAWLAQACAKAGFDGETRPVVAPTLALTKGSFAVERGRPGFVIGAPHGTSDSSTDLIGLDLARRTGFGLVVATGFAFLDAEGRRFNVNRPTESVPGVPRRLEVETGEARSVFEAYRSHVAAAARSPLRLYVEIHGNGRKASAERIEVATAGVTPEEAWRLKTLLEMVRDAHLRLDGAGEGSAPRLVVLVEPLDRLHYNASAAREAGMFAAAERVLHLELPRSARGSHRELYTAVLADFLSQAAALFGGSDGRPSTGGPSGSTPPSGRTAPGLLPSGIPSSGLPTSGVAPASVLPPGLSTSGLPSSGASAEGLSSGHPSDGRR